MPDQRMIISEFNDATNWTAENDFVLHEDDPNGDRPLLVRSSPQRLLVDLTDIELAEGVYWERDETDRGIADVAGKDTPDYEPHYDPSLIQRGSHKSLRAIYAKGTMRDYVTVFSLEAGAVAQFRELSSISIRPIEPPQADGKPSPTRAKAAELEQLVYGRRRKGGYLLGEPGHLCAQLDNAGSGPTLSLEGYIDELEFDRLFDGLTRSRGSTEIGKAQIVAELFTSALADFAHEPPQRREFGLMIPKSDFDISLPHTRARVDSLNFAFAAGKPDCPRSDLTPVSPFSPTAPPREASEPATGRREPYRIELEKALRPVVWLMASVLAVLVLGFIYLVSRGL